MGLGQLTSTEYGRIPIWNLHSTKGVVSRFRNGFNELKPMLRSPGQITTQNGHAEIYEIMNNAKSGQEHTRAKTKPRKPLLAFPSCGLA